MIDLTKLRADVQEALHLWDNQMVDNPLHYLHNYQQLVTTGATNGSAVNQLLTEAIDHLATSHVQEANLLRLRFWDKLVMSAVANRLNIAESTANRKQREAIDYLAAILYEREQLHHQQVMADLEQRLNLPNVIPLVGVSPALTLLLDLLQQPQAPWIVSLEGLGGLGKTALANYLVRQVAVKHHFQGVGWVSAQQQAFLGQRIQNHDQPALTIELLTNTLLKQLWNIQENLTLAEKKELLQRQLKLKPHLIVIDNLETAVDYETLLPVLRQWSNPSRFLLTTRHSLQHETDIYCYSLAALSVDDSLTLIRQEAVQRGIQAVAQAEVESLHDIYNLTGGNPLALKLVVGQLSMLPLGQVLTGLKQADNRSVDELYTYIYWQAWQLLLAVSRQLLLIMPLAQNGSLEQLAQVSGLTMTELTQAIEQLRQLSLLTITGGVAQRHYAIHRLTETFLLHEVVKWQSLS